jgi:hypothetical protein
MKVKFKILKRRFEMFEKVKGVFTSPVAQQIYVTVVIIVVASLAISAIKVGGNAAYAGIVNALDNSAQAEQPAVES